MTDRLAPGLREVAVAVASACGLPDPPASATAADWPRFVRLAARHEVVSLVERSGWLERAGAPPEVAAAIVARARRNALRTLQTASLQREVVDALTAAGIDVIVLKGIAVAVAAYGDPNARGAGDIDILVGRESVPQAVAALESRGLEWYGWKEPEDRDRPLAGQEAMDRLSHLPMLRDVTMTREGVQVELHWRLFRNPRLMPVDAAWLQAPWRLDVHGSAIPTLPPAAEWLYLVLHGSLHVWSRMKWLADVLAMSTRSPELVQPAALSRAATVGYGRPVAGALMLAEAVFGPFLEPEARSWASGVRGTSRLVEGGLEALRADDRDPGPPESPRALPQHARWRLAMRRDARYRLEELRLLALKAGRAQGIEDPGLLDLLAGPWRWARRMRREAGRA